MKESIKMESTSLIPGYMSYVAGETADPQSAERQLHMNGNALWNVCYHVMYSFESPDSSPDEYYHLGVNRFLRKCREVMHTHGMNTHGIDGVLIYFYNRQFLIQLTSHPKPFPGQNISIPIDRAPMREIQADVMYLLEEQRIANFNLPYLLVIVDPFSRFVWAHPIAKLESTMVRKAFFLALSRPGAPRDYYHHIRGEVRRVVVDGGSEFKDSFRGNFKYAFPNSELVVSSAKRTSHGRPTNTGPVEAAIGTLRRVLRDHELGVSRQFLANRQSGLDHALHAYNTMPQTQTLQHHSPQEVVEGFLGGSKNPGLISHLNGFMKEAQNKKVEKKRSVLEQYGVNGEGESQLAKDRHGSTAYRLYLPPPPFSKAVTPRVGVDVYVISKIHGGGEHNPTVDLIEYGHGEKRLQRIHLKQLVLVKAPIEEGPAIVKRQVLQRVEDMRVRHTPREVSIAYDISPEIRRAVGAIRIPELENQRMDQNPIQRNVRQRVLPHHLQDYRVG